MAKKIRNNIINFLNEYDEGKSTIKFMIGECEKLAELVYQMKFYGLVSDAVADECFEAIDSFKWAIAYRDKMGQEV